jgi:RND family efflux transporter MFP subunit
MRYALTCPTLALVLFPALAGAAPPEVRVSRPIVREVADQEDFTGRTEASTTVEVRARVAGYLEKVHFEEGAEVKKGDALFQLDDRPYRAEMEKAQAEVARAEARLKLAEAENRRATKLLQTKAISPEEVDKIAASLEVERAGVQVARAELDRARLNLEFTRIASPIDGKAGQALVGVGNFIGTGAGRGNVLTTVAALHPLHVYFHVDEKTLVRLQRLSRERKDKGEKVAVGLGLAGEAGYPRQAIIDFSDNRVDAETATVQVRAVLPNPKGEVYPGQFVRVRLTLGPARKALLVPDAGVTRTSAGARVLVVNDKNILEERPVKLGPLAGGLRVIEEGLGPNDWVVVGGLPGLKAGDEIKPRREKMPAGAAPGEELRPGGTGWRPPLPEFPGVGPALLVTTIYPGANARTVQETVAAPIEKQLDGLEGVVHRFLVCTDEGEMRLTLTFKKGTDLNTAMVLARNRVALAEPRSRKRSSARGWR